MNIMVAVIVTSGWWAVGVVVVRRLEREVSMDAKPFETLAAISVWPLAWFAAKVINRIIKGRPE